jgi:Tfp pilus assembly protein PilX
MNPVNAQRGVALVTTLAIIVVVGALILGSIITTQVEMAITRNDNTAAQAQYVAQAGLQTYKAALFQNFRWVEGGSPGGTNLDVCSNSISGGIDFTRTGVATAWVNDRMSLPDVNIASATGTTIGTAVVELVRDPGNDSRITIRSVGRTLAGGATSRAQATASATFIIRNSSTLEQAIFAGAGSDMRFINGNTTIYGGIYVVGDLANPDNVVIQSNGNLGIYNSYNKTSGTGNFLVPAAQSSNNLCAALRVQSGKVAVGGSTQLGTNANKLLTVAIGRGLEDVSTAQGGTLECQNNKGICSETPVGPFDLDPASAPVFPLLDEPPATEFCPTGTWRDCIRAEAAADGLTLTTAAGNSAFTASPAVDDNGNPFPASCTNLLATAAAATNKELVLGSTTVDCTFTLGERLVGFRYTATNPATFETFGNINLRGFDLRFNRAVAYTAISRSATGTVQQFANLSIEKNGTVGGNFRSEESFVTNAAQKFPNNVLSIVAEVDANFRGGNNTYVTAPVYAGEVFRITSSTVLFGQVIANQFCTTSPGGSGTSCATAGSPAEIVFVPTGANRAPSFRAIAPTGGLPTFNVASYELR